mmetsp:Transcript_144476/g.462957  ORF Transcript_144476/g.462957 Transcript_144476/m.462957 type:complete len:258 (-) Transcript_144476:760-1533(-)
MRSTNLHRPTVGASTANSFSATPRRLAASSSLFLWASEAANSRASRSRATAVPSCVGWPDPDGGAGADEDNWRSLARDSWNSRSCSSLRARIAAACSRDRCLASSRRRSSSAARSPCSERKATTASSSGAPDQQPKSAHAEFAGNSTGAPARGSPQGRISASNTLIGWSTKSEGRLSNRKCWYNCFGKSQRSAFPGHITKYSATNAPNTSPLNTAWLRLSLSAPSSNSHTSNNRRSDRAHAKASSNEPSKQFGGSWP